MFTGQTQHLKFALVKVDVIPHRYFISLLLCGYYKTFFSQMDNYYSGNFPILEAILLPLLNLLRWRWSENIALGLLLLQAGPRGRPTLRSLVYRFLLIAK